MPQPATVPIFDARQPLRHRIFFRAVDLPRFLERAPAFVGSAMRSVA